eukprot:gene3567-4080_t
MDPVTGKPMTMKDLFKANFAVNKEVIIRTTGNVYSHEAVQKLNIEAKNFTDLLEDTPFVKSDIITLQNPADPSRRNLRGFHYVKAGLEIKETETTSNITLTESTQRIFKSLREKGIPLAESDTSIQEKEAKLTATRKQSGQAPSFTSTGVALNTVIETHPADKPGKKTKNKGYVRIKTNVGDLNVQLHCDLVPKACENFLELCEDGYYNGLIFHRLIKNFMVQGGDPTGTGTGGQSVWKRPFADEFKPSLSHSERGILSMANSGSNTNGSQFFITLRPCTHLDRKHTVFGKVVGGIEVLKTIELIKTDDDDRPTSQLKIVGTQVFENPFRNLDKEEFEALQKAEQKKKEKEISYDDQQ